MSKRKKTSSGISRKAAKTLGNHSTTKTTKSLAGSTRAYKRTTPKSPAASSGMLSDYYAARTARSLTGSVLSQRKSGKKKTTAKKRASTFTLTLIEQHVATRRTAKGEPVRVVLAPYRGGSLRRDRVESVVSTVLARHRKKP